MRRNGIALIGGLGVICASALFSQTSAAYCRTTTCDLSVDTCATAPDSICVTTGIPLFWAGPCASYALNQSSTPGISYQDFSAVGANSFGAWTVATCSDGQHPSIRVFDIGPTSVDRVEYNVNGPNGNIVVFRSDTWPYPGSPETLALTTVTFASETGEIYDADMEINSADNDITVGDSGIVNDLQSIMTHEAGHFWGLAHSDDPTATMYASYIPGSTSKRTLSPDDILGICTVYPSSRQAGPCDPSPRHGFYGSPDPDASGGCAVANAPASHSAWLGATLALLAAYAIRMRRRS